MNASVAHFVFNLTSYSGAAQQALALCQHMPQRQHLIFNVELGRKGVDTGETKSSGLQVIHLPSQLGRSLPFVLRTLRLRSISIVHLHGLVGVGLLAGLVLRRKIILKTTLLGKDDFSTLRARRWGRSIHALLHFVDINVVLSKELEKINSSHFDPRRIERIPNGVGLPLASPVRGLAIFCTVGLVCSRKRTHLAIEKFLSLYADNPEAQLYVVGPDGRSSRLREADADYAGFCRSLVPRERRHQVIFTGALTKSEVQKIYDRSIALLFLSEAEGMPNVVLEAMASNCVPILAPMRGVAEEMIIHGESGFIIRNDEDFPSLPAVQRISASLATRYRAKTNFSFHTIATRYSEIYQRLARRGAS